MKCKQCTETMSVLSYVKSPMPVKTFLFVSLIITLFFCHYNFVVCDVVESETVYHDREIEGPSGPRPPGDVDIKVSVDTAEPLSHVEDCFVSFNIDSQEFGERFEKMNFRLIYLFAVFTNIASIVMFMHEHLGVCECEF